jgi:CubicO group peptidase (beta-lactamase class C family)
VQKCQNQEPLSQTDKVHVGSVSKTILAAGFLRMATVGLLYLDDPVKKYLPHLPIANEYNSTDPVTIRHLLNHTSGLTDAKLWHIFSTKSAPHTPLETVYLNSPNILKVHTKPGSIYSYSNLGYTILGMVMEKISKKPYENYLDESILKPLGMANSSFQFISQTTDNQLAFGHFDDGEPVVALPMYLRPAGQLTTTAEDIGKFLRFMMSDGIMDNKPFIDNEYLKAVGKQELTDAYKRGVPFGDALGAYSRDRYGVVGIAKNGNTLGFSAMIYMFPNHKKAFFIAYNMDSETANYDLFNEVLVNHLGLPTQHVSTEEQNTESDIENWNGFYIPVITKVEPFGLLDIVFSHTKVETSKTGALLMPFQGKHKALIYQGKNLFSMKDRIKISHAFYKDTDGELVITDGVKTIKKISGLKIIGIASSLVLGISGLVSLFISGCINLMKSKLAFKNNPVVWVFISISTLILSFASITAQPFMSMGDLTIGNFLLATATLMLPIFSIITFILIIKRQRMYLHSLSFWSTVFVIQFCVLLIANNLMPLILWK